MRNLLRVVGIEARGILGTVSDSGARNFFVFCFYINIGGFQDKAGSTILFKKIVEQTKKSDKHAISLILLQKQTRKIHLLKFPVIPNIYRSNYKISKVVI